jgi:hypothetical protein
VFGGVPSQEFGVRAGAPVKAAPAFRYPERCQPNQERQIMADQGETPVYIATQQPPSAEARGVIVAVIVTVAAPGLADHVGQVEVEMPIESAKHLIVQLGKAVKEAMINRGV